VDPVPLVALQREWEVLAHGRLRLELRTWSVHEAALARFDSPDRLIGFLWDRRAPSEEKDRVLLALLRLARRESSASRVVLHAMLPGLKTLAAAMLKRHPEHGDPAVEREELWQVLFVEMLERIKRYPLERRPASVAANLVLDVKHAVLAAAQRARAAAGELPLDEPLEPDEQALRARPEVDVEAPLRRAVAAKAITAADAELLLLVDVDEVALREAARRLGLSYNLARIRIQRARKRLLMFLRPWTQDLYVQIEPKPALDGPSSGAYAPEAITDTQEQAG
jgi:DNA-directed RNA polymerase specialized sigma24 family protein